MRRVMIKLIITKIAKNKATKVSIFAAQLLKWVPNITNILEPKMFNPIISYIFFWDFTLLAGQLQTYSTLTDVF